MKKKFLSIMSSLLTATLLLSMLAACSPKEEETTGTNQTSAEETTAEETASQSNEPSGSESATESKTETGTATDDTSETETESNAEEVPSPELDGLYGPVIKNAYDLSNNIDHYFSDPERKHARLENSNMIFDYTLTDEEDILATLKNKKGGVYVDNTMDVYVTMDSGKTYYSSKSISPARSNSFRYGYYYYDVRFFDHCFINSVDVVDELEIPLRSFTEGLDMSKPKVNQGILRSQITSALDPRIFGKVEFSTDKYNALSITLKTTSTTSLDVFFIAGEKEEFSYDQSIKIDVLPDGQFHTYQVLLNRDDLVDYNGNVTSLRFDFNGEEGEVIEISEVKALERFFDNAPHLFFDRTLHTFSEKVNQVVHIVAGSEVTGIREIGMLTEIDANTVDKVIAFDKNGPHDTFDGVDWNSIEYVGFDIKNVGIFGYILLADETSGKLQVTLENGVYTIKQSRTPENGTIHAPVSDTSNDFYMGHRLYTDENHDFDAFIYEATIERSPLKAENIVVNTEASPNSTYDGYDALRGMYKFTLPPNISFQDSYDNRANEHNNVVFTVKGDEYNRNVYVLAYAFTTDIECAAILDNKEMMLPIALEVCKNFKHEHEEPRFDKGDVRYSEAIFPVQLTKDDEYTFKVIHLYQNWGRYPLKQLSSIQFFAPYYHLSTGTTETNCIANQYVHGKDLFTLPDHRAMSAPMWENQPQHSSGGYHYFLRYTDSEGHFYGSENTVNTILSSGPTYADLEMINVSDDGKIKVTYTHMEMPQIDENRTYYTMKYEILEDISFNNFLEDFSFYTMAAFHGTYAHLGYLNENNECTVTDTNMEGTKKTYVLGDKAPYFDYFKMIEGEYVDDYVNLSCIISNSKFVIGGKEVTPQFAIVDHNDEVRLSLNYEKLALSAGDEMYISMIIMPWGSHESIYDGSNGKAPDQNVRDVRANSILDPAIATPLSRCEAVENEFIPMIRTTDGKIATFSISGGENNIVVRVYGFTTLTVPRIYERIGDEWVQYRVSSAATPDKLGNAHPYDGYCVHYDGDGTYSYSFIVTMDGGKERNLRVIADKEFSGWTDEDRYPEIEGDDEEVETEPLLLYFSPDEMKDSSMTGVGEGTKVMKDDSGKFIRFFGNGTSGEATISLVPLLDTPTGQYVAIKYRIPTTNPENAKESNLVFDVFTSTENREAAGTNVAYTSGIIPDGEWHVIVFDITKFPTNTEFKADDNGAYSAKFIRFDVFNVPMSTESYMDIAYVGMSDSIEEICKINTDLAEISVAEGCTKDQHKIIDPSNYVEEVELFDFFFSASNLKNINVPDVSSMELKRENDKTFIRYYGNGDSGETYFTMLPAGSVVSGQYVVIKYRVPTTNAEAANTMWFDVFTSTVNKAPVGLIDYAYTYGIIGDGEWHVMVIDVTKFSTCTLFEADADGKYKANFLRLDIFNQVTSTESYIDIAYVGMCDSIEKICEVNSDIPEITLSEGITVDKHKIIDTATGKEKE